MPFVAVPLGVAVSVDAAVGPIAASVVAAAEKTSSSSSVVYAPVKLPAGRWRRGCCLLSFPGHLLLLTGTIKGLTHSIDYCCLLFAVGLPVVAQSMVPGSC